MRQAVIYWKNHRAGVLIESDEGFSFRYDEAYLRWPDAQAISLTLPLQTAPHNNRILHPFFDGLIPEGWLLDVAERNWKLNVKDRMGLLLACCRDCIGAVSVRPLEEEQSAENVRTATEERTQTLAPQSKVNGEEEALVVDKQPVQGITRCLCCYQPLKEGETDYHVRCCRRLFGTSKPPLLPYSSAEVKGLADAVVRSQTAVTGVQAKLSLSLDRMSRNPERFTIVGLWGQFILKPQSERFEHLPELEDLTMHLAELAKIETVPHGLLRFSDGALCYVTRRIDRTSEGEKLAMEDMCQLTERPTDYKYKGSHEQVAKIIAQHSAVPKLDLTNYWQQVVFSWIVGNADMHLKNYSLFVPEGNEHLLSPAYDLLSTQLVLPEDPEELALTVCGKKRKLTAQHFLSAMENSGIQQRVARNIFSRFQRILPKWEDFIAQSFLPETMKSAYIALIRQRVELLTKIPDTSK